MLLIIVKHYGICCERVLYKCNLLLNGRHTSYTSPDIHLFYHVLFWWGDFDALLTDAYQVHAPISFSEHCLLIGVTIFDLFYLTC